MWRYLILVILCPGNLGYPTGAPNYLEVCDAMVPGHSVAGQSKVERRFTVSCKPKGRDQVEFTIKAKHGSFKGLLLQIRNKRGKLIGRFEDKYIPNGFKTTCDGRGLTHSNPDLKEGLVKIIADVNPADLGDATCTFTVVEAFSKIWIKQTKPIARSPPPAPKPDPKRKPPPKTHQPQSTVPKGPYSDFIGSSDAPFECFCVD